MLTPGKGRSKKQQQGTFAIELALIAAAVAATILLISNVVTFQIQRGVIQRLSFYAANIGSYAASSNSDSIISEQQFRMIYSLVSQSMSRSLKGFQPDALGMQIKQSGVVVVSFSRNPKPDKPCNATEPLRRVSETLSSPKISQLQVTLCYTDNNNTFTLGENTVSSIQASAILPVRIKDS
ncbi:tight adherence pilus pseudopilin TadF [Spongorhabdus nitratireducens]